MKKYLVWIILVIVFVLIIIAMYYQKKFIWDLGYFWKMELIILIFLGLLVIVFSYWLYKYSIPFDRFLFSKYLTLLRIFVKNPQSISKINEAEKSFKSDELDSYWRINRALHIARVRSRAYSARWSHLVCSSEKIISFPQNKSPRQTLAIYQ